MNQSDFIKKINKKIEFATKKNYKNIINEILKKISTDDYQDVLLIVEKNLDLLQDDVTKKIELYKDFFQNIIDRKLVFTYTTYEDYENYACDAGLVTEYYDNQNIGLKLDGINTYILNLMNSNKFEEALILLKLLVLSSYICKDDCFDEITLSLKDLYFEKLINFDYNKTYINYIYLVLLVSKNKVKDIYEFYHTTFSEISIDSVFKDKDENVPNLESFYKKMIDFLKNKKGQIEDKLLLEAFNYLKFNNYKKYLFYINKYHSAIYSDLFLYLWKNNKITELVETGNYALNNLKKDSFIRSEVALLLAGYDSPNKGKYLYENFISNRTVSNLIRLINNGYLKEYQDKLNITKSDNEYYFLIFFLGRFEEILKDMNNLDENKKEELINLFIPLLHKGNIITPGYEKILEHNLLFTNQDMLSCDSSIEWYKWKKTINLKKDTENKIKKLLNKTVCPKIDAILKRQERKSYYYAAMLLVAYSETLETLNVIKSEDFINKYLKEYSKYIVFKREIKYLTKSKIDF